MEYKAQIAAGIVLEILSANADYTHIKRGMARDWKGKPGSAAQRKNTVYLGK